MKETQDRDELLRLMGFANYEAYLTSELWAWITSNLSKLELSKSCLRCGSASGLLWHHRRYTLDVLTGNFRMVDREKNLSKFRLNAATHAGNPIVRLCSDCHRFVHFWDDGEWIGSLEIVDKRLFEAVECIHEVRKAPEQTNEFDEYMQQREWKP